MQFKKNIASGIQYFVKNTFFIKFRRTIVNRENSVREADCGVYFHKQKYLTNTFVLIKDYNNLYLRYFNKPILNILNCLTQYYGTSCKRFIWH